MSVNREPVTRMPDINVDAWQCTVSQASYHESWRALPNKGINPSRKRFSY